MVGRRLAIPLVVVVGAVASGAVAGAFLGVPGLSGAATTAATGPSGSSGPSGANPAPHVRGAKAEIEAAAKALNLTTDQLLQKLSDGKTTIADVATQQNVPLDKVIDAMVDADRQRIEDFVHNPLPARDNGPGHGFGRAKFGRPFGIGEELDAAAKALGLSSTQDLLNELRNGKTIADVAQEKNVDLNKVIDAMVAAGNARIDAAKDAGKLDEQQADNLKSKLKDLITKAVNGDLGPKGGFGFGAMVPGGFGHMWKGADEGPTAPETPPTPGSTEAPAG